MPDPIIQKIEFFKNKFEKFESIKLQKKYNKPVDLLGVYWRTGARPGAL